MNGKITWQGRALHEYAVISVPRGTAAAARVIAAQHPMVEYAARDRYGEFAAPPNDPLYPGQWYHKNTGQTYPYPGPGGTPLAGVQSADIRMEPAWGVPPFGTVSENIVIAVIDRGVDYIPQVFPNLWINPEEGPVPDGKDNDGNGIIDDIHGAAFLPLAASEECCEGQPQNDPRECGVAPYFRHGTPIAALIGAVANDEKDTAGTSWPCRIMAVRLYMLVQFGACTGHFPESHAIAAIDYAVNEGARVLSCSWRVSRDWPIDPSTEWLVDPVYQAVLRAGEFGALVVFAAGNDNCNLDQPWNCLRPTAQYYSPQYWNTEFDNMIVVGATDHTDNLVAHARWGWGSNYGERVDIAAPGTWLIVPPDARETGYFGGTSGATPLVASVAAQVWTINPSFTPLQVIQRVLCNARPPINIPPFPIRTGGILDAHAALTNANSCPP